MFRRVVIPPTPTIQLVASANSSRWYRHFTKPAICDWNRITIGTAYEMEMLIKALKEITEE